LPSVEPSARRCDDGDASRVPGVAVESADTSVALWAKTAEVTTGVSGSTAKDSSTAPCATWSASSACTWSMQADGISLGSNTGDVSMVTGGVTSSGATTDLALDAVRAVGLSLLTWTASITASGWDGRGCSEAVLPVLELALPKLGADGAASATSIAATAVTGYPAAVVVVVAVAAVVMTVAASAASALALADATAAAAEADAAAAAAVAAVAAEITRRYRSGANNMTHRSCSSSRSIAVNSV
jgi:hypothetical protein